MSLLSDIISVSEVGNSITEVEVSLRREFSNKINSLKFIINNINIENVLESYLRSFYESHGTFVGLSVDSILSELINHLEIQREPLQKTLQDYLYLYKIIFREDFL